MGKARTIRIATALTVIGVGVPLTVIANSHAATAGTTPSTSVAQVGSATGALSGTSAGTATSGTTSGTTSGSASSSGTTTNLPADKMTVAASKLDIAGPNADVVLLSAQMRTSNPADLTFMVSAECSIVTSVTTMGNDSQQAFGQIRMWVTIDGQPVGVIPATQGQSDDGRVVFCNQTYSSTTSGYTVDNPTVNTYLQTKHADAFNWVAMNVGNGVHTVQLHAELTQQVTDPSKDSAQMVVGNRTIVVNTTETAQNQAQ